MFVVCADCISIALDDFLCLRSRHCGASVSNLDASIIRINLGRRGRGFDQSLARFVAHTDAFIRMAVVLLQHVNVKYGQ